MCLLTAGDRVVVATDTGDILVIEGTELKMTLSSGLEGAALHCMVHYQKVLHLLGLQLQ